MPTLTADQLAELNLIATQLYNLARRNGYPADLVHLYTETRATLAVYQDDAGHPITPAAPIGEAR